MKLAVSNIAWTAELDGEAYSLLAGSGIQGIEVAPTRRWPEWEGITPQAIRHYRQEIKDGGLCVSSLQSILYQKPQLLLFGSDSQRDALYQHLCRCADIAAGLGARCLVFGAPKNRDRAQLPENDALNRAIEFFTRVGDEFERRQVCLVFEANPETYGCNFATTSRTAATLVRGAHSAGFRLHLDTACMHLAGEDSAAAIDDAADLLHHFHASEPNLGSFAHPQLPHCAIAMHLTRIGYQGWVALEMRPGDPPMPPLREAIRFFCEAYGESH